MKLFLIDDDNALRGLLALSVQYCFDSVTECGVKTEAEKILHEEQFDVAVVDLSIQEENDGVDLAKKCINNGIKTIVFSANNESDVIKELIKFGIFDYLQKPLAIPTLIASLNRAKLFVENESKLAEENIYHLNYSVDATEGIKNSMGIIEKELLVKILKQNNFNIYKTAKILKTKRENVYYFLNKYDINRPDEL